VTRYFSLRDVWDILVAVILLGIAVYCVQYVRSNPVISTWPQIEYVKVNGKLHATNHEEFENIVRTRVARGFFHIPMHELEQRLAELPWVRHAMVRRVWPHTLKITVYEGTPVARWGNTGLMDAYGELFFPQSVEPYAFLPILFGEQTRIKELARIFKNSMKQLRPLGLKPHGLFEDRRQSKHLVLSNGLILAIGDGDVNKKIARFIIAYEQYLSSRLAEVKKIDLRYTNGLAIEWKNPQLVNNLILESSL